MAGGPAVNPGQRATALTYNQNVRGIWNPLTLLNGWTNVSGYVSAQYRLVDTVTCEIIGTITAGTEVAATELFALPAGYYNPNNDQSFPMFEQLVSGGSTCWNAVRTSGSVTIEGTAVASANYFFHAMISIDA